jgi:hypothetical protein
VAASVNGELSCRCQPILGVSFADGSQIHGNLGHRRSVAIDDLDTDIALTGARGRC